MRCHKFVSDIRQYDSSEGGRHCQFVQFGSKLKADEMFIMDGLMSENYIFCCLSSTVDVQSFSTISRKRKSTKCSARFNLWGAGTCSCKKQGNCREAPATKDQSGLDAVSTSQSDYPDTDPSLVLK